MDKRYKLITRGDFNGVVCAILLKEAGMIDEVTFAHPREIENGTVKVDEDCILANLPYNEAAHLVFEHHSLKDKSDGSYKPNLVASYNNLSTAQIIYNYYRQKESMRKIPNDLMKAVNKAESGHFSKREVKNPRNWDLLNFIMDPRTGLARFKSFKVSYEDMLYHLIEYCRFYKIDKVLTQPDVKERVELYQEHQEAFKEQLKKCTKVYNKKTAVIDYRNEIIIYAGNRFVIYALYPHSSISIEITNSNDKTRVTFAVGRSIFNKTKEIDIGALCSAYGGGGHRNAGTFSVAAGECDETLKKIVESINNTKLRNKEK